MLIIEVHVPTYPHAWYLRHSSTILLHQWVWESDMGYSAELIPEYLFNDNAPKLQLCDTEAPSVAILREDQMWLIPPYNFPGGTYMAKVWTTSITKYGTWPREYNQIWHLAQRV